MTNTTPTDRELEALKVLWDQGEATVRDICDAMRAGGADLAYTTVLSLLQVMEQKKFVGHRRISRAYVYYAAVQRAPTFRQMAGSFLERVFDGAVDEYLVHALDSRQIAPEELVRLERMIANAKQRRSEQQDAAPFRSESINGESDANGASDGKNGSGP